MGRPDSWDYFSKTYRGLLFSVALKSGLSDSEAQEAVQETLISVSRKMSEFKYDPAVGSFKGWLLQVTRRRIADQFRKRPRESCFSARIPGPDHEDRDGGKSSRPVEREFRSGMG